MSYQTVMKHYATPSALVAALVPYGCSITPQAIYKWRESGIPVDRAPLIEAASGGALRCEQICPDTDWLRDAKGNLIGYRVRVSTPRAA